MNRLSRKTLGLITLVILLVLITAALFVKFDHKIKGPVRIVAYSEWTLSNVEQDKLIGSHYFNGTQHQHDMMLFHFQRPDFVRLSLNNTLKIGDIVQAGDIVASFSSSEDSITVAALTGNLKEARANLAALRTGEKQAFQQEAAEALTYAKAELAAYESILQRQKELHAKNLISDQELEVTQAQYELYQINVSVQQARLQSVKTGQKEEMIQVIEAQIQSLADQVNLYQQKLAATSLKSPITGMLIKPNRASSELCHICELDSMVVQMPIKASDIRKIERGAPMSITLPGSPAFDVPVTGINYGDTIINLQPMYLVSSVLVNPHYQIKHGMTANATITTGKSTLWTMLSEAWTNYRFNK